MMNKQLSIISTLVLGILCWAGLAQAQNHPYNTGTQQVVTVAGAVTYYDSGGPGGNYLPNHNNSNTTIRFAPATAGNKIRAVFSQFQTEASFDALYIWDGVDTNAPKIASLNAAPVANNFWGTGGWWSTTNMSTPPNNAGFATVESTCGNANGSLTFGFVSDGSVQYAGWTASVTQFLNAGCCAPVPNPNPLNVGLDPGVCVANVTLNFPTFNPAGCGNIAPRSVSYRVNANPFINIPQPYPTTVTISGLPSGTHTVEWQVLSGTGSGTVLGAAIQTVNVTDTEPPVLTCPANNIINLNPGLCCAIVSWADPTITDNCPFIGPLTSLLQTTTFTNYWPGAFLNLVNVGTEPLIVSGARVQLSQDYNSNFGPKDTRIYMRTGTYVGNTTSSAGWTQVSQQSPVVNTNPLTVSNFEMPFNLATFTIPVGGTAGVYIVTNLGQLGTRVCGTLGNAPTQDANLQINQNPSNWANYGLFTGTIFPSESPRLNLRFDYQTGGEGVVTKIEGPDSGDELCKDDSPWTVTYEGFDAVGNRGECSFTIEVYEYANPVSKLTCNDNVQISLGENCLTEVGADDILEGGPYGCYDDYQVMIFNQQNIPLASSPFVGSAQIGPIWKVKVTDPDTGNSCWGTIIVEDKWKPTMVCQDLNVPCGVEIPLAPAPDFFAAAQPLQYPISFLNHGGGVVFSLSGNTQPGGVYVNVTNNSTSTYRLTGFGIRFGNPAFGAVNPPQTMQVYSKAGTFAGFETTPGAWVNNGPYTITDIPPYFATGTGPLAQLPLNAPIELLPGQTRAFHIFGQTACPIFNYFTQTAPVTNGPFTVAGGPVSFGLFGPLFQAGAASMPNIQVNYEEALQAIPVTDNCSPDLYMNTIGQGLAYGEDIVYYTCAENADFAQTIYRVWTATDQWGNSTQCTQQINIRRATINTLELPPNFDDLPDNEPSFDCKDGYPTPEYINANRGSGGYPAGGGCGSLQFEYWDKVLNVCQGSYTIIRSWTIHDMCTGDIGKVDQVIKVLDKTPPVLFCPSEGSILVGQTKNNGYQDCTARVLLPWIQVTDDCSTTNNITFYVWTVLPDGSIVIVNTMNAQGYFEFNLPVQPAPHQYTFTYTAIDDCGNKSECTVNKAVRDLTPPVVICETYHVVALSDSITFINAESFDDGSYDDCSMVTFAARRGTMNAAGAFVQHPCNQPGDFLYNPQVRFYCCDINHATPLFVDLRVRDAYGNDNFCMVPVTVVDKVRPTILCPVDITVQCGMPYTPTGVDTFVICKQPNIKIKDAFAFTYNVPLDIFGIPADAQITDLDLKLNIDHDVVNQLRITLYSPLNRKAQVLPVNSCVGQPAINPMNINVTFNDQAYNIAQFQATGQRVPANFTCTSAMPGIGAFNQGHMKPKGDELKIFNGQPLNSFTNKNLCFTVSATDITLATKRMSNFQVQQFIFNAGLQPGDRILLEYAQATGSPLGGLTVGNIYLFQVINATTIEFLAITGSDLLSVPAGSTHMFCASGTWLLVIEDTAPLAGGNINEVCMSIGYVRPTGLKPLVSDNTEECGLTVTYQDLGTPDKCADNTFINRRWTVNDGFGNNTNCIQRVYFSDDTPLTVQFPCDVTVNCPITPDATGEPLHNGDCELVGVEYNDHVLVTTDACYKILRTWILKDWCKYRPDGNVDYTTTNINEALEQVTFSTAINPLFTERKINVGDRFTLRYVTSGSVEIPGLVEGDVYSVTRISGTTVQFDYNTTKQQAVNITGQGTGPHIFRYANSDLGLPLTCDVLLEWYPFINWYTACCNPVAERRAWEDDGDGYFKFTQEIKVVDNTAPQWVDCSNKDFCSYEANCQPTFIELICPATDNCTPEDQLKYTYEIDAFNDGTIDITGIGNDASGAYPNGTHRIIFKVTDQCGNWNTCTKLFTIRDCKKPTPICINGLSVDLMPSTGMAAVWAESLEAGDSYDNCTSYPNLKFLVERLSALTPGQSVPTPGTTNEVIVTCDDLPPVTASPIVEVVVWVGDEAGNWDYCITTIWVQDNMGACGSGQSAVTASTVNEGQDNVEYVDVMLNSGNKNEMKVTGSTGSVNFTDLTPNASATITPHKDIHPLNGVSTYDLLLIQKHLLGIKALTSPYKLIAADVNNSQGVSISDIIELRKMILNPGLDFANNTSWRFVDAEYVFPNAAKPWGFPETKTFASLLAGTNNIAKFISVKVGDVSGDHTPNSLLGGEVRNSVGTLAFAIEDQQLTAGQEYTVTITADQFRNIQGYQYTLDFNAEALEFVSVDAVWSELSTSNFGRAKASEGIITTSWNGSEGITLADGEVLYTVTFRAKTNSQLSQVLKVNSKVTRAEAYDMNEELLEVKFRFDGTLVVGGEFELYQNEPNPFRDYTVIGFNLPEATKATLKVFDVTGKVVKVVSGDYAKGYNVITLTRSEIPGQGTLIYQLDTDSDSASKRMILVD